MLYLFLYTCVDEFEFLGLILMDSNKQRKYVFEWDFFVRKTPNNEGYSQFISSYMTIRYKFIHNVSHHESCLSENKSFGSIRTLGWVIGICLRIALISGSMGVRFVLIVYMYSC